MKKLAETPIDRILVTLLLIYLYVKPGQYHLNSTDDMDVDVEEDDEYSSIYGSMYGPLGDYAVLDRLRALGYVRNVSKRRSRWAEIILTHKGAIAAQQIEVFWRGHPDFLSILTLTNNLSVLSPPTTEAT